MESLREFVEEVGWRDFHYVGHSLGGEIGTILEFVEIETLIRSTRTRFDVTIARARFDRRLYRYSLRFNLQSPKPNPNRFPRLSLPSRF